MLGQVIPSIQTRRSLNATDFGEASVATMIGNGWTVGTTLTSNLTAAIVASATSISGKRANIVKTTSDGYRLVRWDRVGSVSDTEILALLHLVQDPAGTDTTTGQMTARAASDGDPYYVCLPVEVSSSKKFEIGEGDGAGGGARLGNVSKSWDTTNLWWIRFRLVGSSIKGKMWQYQTAEATTWELDFTDATVASGYVGLGMFYTDANYAVLWYSVATDGATAPSPGG